MEKKIAIIIERANIALGGAERSVFELASALSACGPSVDILAAKGPTDTRNVHILCTHETGKRVSFQMFAKTLREYLSQNHYDIVHSVLPFNFADVYQPRGGTYAEAIVRNAASYRNAFLGAGKKLTAFFNVRRHELLWEERKLSQGTDGPTIVALSQYVAEQFKQHYRTDEQRIVVVPNGVKTNRRISLGQADRLRTQILTEGGLREADEPVLFLFVANNFRLKGLAVLIEAMAVAAPPGIRRKCCLVVIGHDKTFKYRRLARKLGLGTGDRRIVFLGPVSHIEHALKVCDVAVLPTFYDPASRFILEALAAGKPVITTRYNGATDLFVNDRHGKVIDSLENISALAEAINYFTDTSNIERASQAVAEDDLKTQISVRRAAEQLMEVYESILNKKGGK